MTPLAATLIQLRTARGLTQRDLALASGVTRATLQNLEQSRVFRTRRHVIDALADALGVEPDVITTDVYDPTRPHQPRPADALNAAAPKPPVVLSIGPRLRHWREERGYSQETLATRAGLSRQGIQKMEGGSRHVKPSTVRQLAEALGITVHDLAPDFEAAPPTVAPAVTDPHLAAVQALAACVLAYDPAALVVAGLLDSDVGGNTYAVHAWLSDNTLALYRDKDAWADYLVRHADPARLDAALADLAAVPEPPAARGPTAAVRAAFNTPFRG